MVKGPQLLDDNIYGLHRGGHTGRAGALRARRSSQQSSRMRERNRVGAPLVVSHLHIGR